MNKNCPDCVKAFELLQRYDKLVGELEASILKLQTRKDTRNWWARLRNKPD